MFRKIALSALASLAAVPLLLPAAPAQACGGLFCSAAQPVNQAAEQIIFSENGDGTVTAIIQIMYDGPSERFAWVLPVPGVPEVGVSSEQALSRLKASTDPVYQLNTVFEDGCNVAFANGAASPSLGDSSERGAAGGGGGPAVVVEAAGTVGPYDYEVISLDPNLDSPAQVALDWLMDNGYDVTELGPKVLAPYLEDELNLLAFRLTKNSSSGSIRPVMLTYDAEHPMIPIRPTAVAANDDMGIMVWVLSKDRAIPENYRGLELNEALIDWFNPNNNYNEVVTRAADEAGGQGFVTEFAGEAESFGQVVFPDFEEQDWQSFSNQQFVNPNDMVREATLRYNGWDGFDDALRASVTLPADVEYDDFKRCMPCYSSEEGFAIDTTGFLKRVFEDVVKPMSDTRELIESRPYITRLYTTMSAEEMTMDPVFDFNPDLPDVSNQHTADRIVSCDDVGGDQPWRVVLPQGQTVRGLQAGTWPVELDDAPAALRIVQFSTVGAPKVVQDMKEMVTMMIDARNQVTEEEIGQTGGGGCSVSDARGTRGTLLLSLLVGTALILRRHRRRA